MADIPLRGGARMFSQGVGTTSGGVTVTASATANTMGSIVELVASTEAECCHFNVVVTDTVFLSNASFLLDILIGGGGSEEILIEGMVGEIDYATNHEAFFCMAMPLNIPAGSRISARVQTSSATADTVSVMTNYTVPSAHSHPGYQKCESLGVVKATTNGTLVPSDNGSNTKSSWVEFASTSEGYAGFQLTRTVNNNGAMSNYRFLTDVGVGSAGNEEVIAEDIFGRTVSTERLNYDAQFIPVEIPAGTRIALRHQVNGNNADDRDLTYVLHALR